MTWFGNSFSNLKDQITTLTKEVLAEADEEQERKLFSSFLLSYLSIYVVYCTNSPSEPVCNIAR